MALDLESGCYFGLRNQESLCRWIDHFYQQCLLNHHYFAMKVVFFQREFVWVYPMDLMTI